MPNAKGIEQKTPTTPNPSGRSNVTMNHPVVWILDLILAEVDRQVTEAGKENQVRKPHEEGSEEQGTYLSTPQRMGTEHIPENVLENVEECETPNLIESLKEKVKKNITNCREYMARQKQMLSFKDQFGNLLVGRGRGKFGPKRRKKKMTTTIVTETPASSFPVRERPLLGNMFQALQSVAPDFGMTDNEEGPIGGATDKVGQPPVSGEVEQTLAMEVEVEQQPEREEANVEDEMEEDNLLRGANSGRGGGAAAICMAAAAKNKKIS